MIELFYFWGIPAVIAYIAFRVVKSDEKRSTDVGPYSHTVVWAVGFAGALLFAYFADHSQEMRLEGHLAHAMSECHNISSRASGEEEDAIEYLCQEISDARDLNGKRPAPF